MSPSSMCPTGTITSAAHIPLVNALRTKLDYGNPKLARCIDLYDDMKVFAKKFQFIRGLSGNVLYDWKSEKHQKIFDEMTSHFLNDERRGVTFWPDDRTSDYYNKFQYSNDHPLIAQLVKQLFFRLVNQTYRNRKYKHRKSRTADNPVDKPYENNGATANSDSGATECDTIVYRSPAQQDTSVSAPASRTNASLVIYAVLSRSPVEWYKELNLEKEFLETALHELIEDLPLSLGGCIMALSFRIRSQRFNLEQQIYCDDEIRFRLMKELFYQKIRKHPEDAACLSVIEIEPLWGEESVGQ